MSSFSGTLLRIFALAALAYLAGCSIQSQKDSPIPWEKPADWEGQVPGMGTEGSGAGR